MKTEKIYIKKLNSLFKIKIIRFIVSGLLGASLNLLLIFIFVDLFRMDTFFLENIANVFSLELSIIFSFLLNRNWTWQLRLRNQRYSCFIQFLFFHVAVGISVLFRIILFPIIQLININYLINTAIGISLGAIMNYFSLDKLVFVIKGK